MSDIGLNQEQEVMLALMLMNGASEAAARREIAQHPMLATSLGSALMPPIKALAETGIRAAEEAMTSVLDTIAKSSEGAAGLRAFLDGLEP